MKEIKNNEPKPVVINQMPTVEELTDFLKAMHGDEVKVAFDLDKGIFVRLEDREGK